MAFCVSSLDFRSGHFTDFACLRILEMQVVICELVGKFAFTIPENDPISVHLVNTLHPTMKSGRKGVPLQVSRIL
jgi:hypothetical protein